MTNDAELLRSYARERSEPAFTEFVQRHVDLVYRSALRRMGGNEHLAVEVVQHVFTMAARRAGSLARHQVLAAWLYAATRNAALNLRRTEHRRRMREQAAAMSDWYTATASETDWERLRPVLDQAMDELGERDREAVLLRFFEGRSFTDISERLQLTENAARMRVERALDKLQALLGRRGIASTSAALGLAMANEAVMAAPGGLAASVSGAAVAAGSGGVVGQLLTFMGTTKTTGSLAGIAIVLALSLGTNVYLYLRASENDVSAATMPAPAQSQAVPVKPPADALAQSVNGDLATLRDQLRTAGADDASIRATLEGILRRRYREKLSQNRAEKLHNAWWLDPDRTSGTGVPGSQGLTDDTRLLREMVTDPLEALLGPDPLAVAEAEARYAFLPAELRQPLGRLDRQKLTGFTATGDPETDSALKADFEARSRATDEELQKLLATLTPEQRTAYDMHFGSFATALSRQLAKFPVTEDEFEKVFPIAQNYKNEIAALPPGATRGSEERRELELHTAENLVAAFGEERALDFIWVSSLDYAAYARVVRDAKLPDGTVGRTLQLASDTGWQAAAIHADATLTLEQKRDALAALQQSVQPRLDALLPAEVQQRLTPTVRSWITLLGQGSYKLTDPVLPGETNITVMAGAVSVDSKVPIRVPSKLGGLFGGGK